LQAKNDFGSHNNTVKDVCKEIGLGNPFDATKLDNKTKLPEILLENDYAVIHIGDGKHKFIKGISDVFHDFEPVRETLIREYTKSVLNQYNSSESNILSIANNRRIYIIDTEFENTDIVKRPKTCFPHRTKTSSEYYFGKADAIAKHSD
jgi:hypothetical protein